MIRNLFILGGHIQALGLARQAKRKGLAVTLIIPDGFSVARFSRYVDCVVICHNEIELTKFLTTKADLSIFLFPTSDEYIDYILKNHAWLKGRFTIALPEPKTVKLFADKKFTYSFAQNHLIPHPWSLFPKDYEDAKAMADRVAYPVIIKPAIMYDFHRRFGKKAYLCEDKDSMLLKMANLSAQGYPISGLILQEFLSGGAKNLFSFGFFSANGVVKSSIIVNRIRQNPMDFGNSTTFAVTTDIPEIKETAERIIHLTNYTGMGEVEFMYDKGEYKFLEINTRAWKWHTISEGRGFSFIGDWIDWLNHGDIDLQKENNISFAWVERFTDFAVIAKGLCMGEIRFKDVLKSYRRQKVYAVWTWKDPLPAIMYLLMSPFLFIKRY